MTRREREILVDKIEELRTFIEKVDAPIRLFYESLGRLKALEEILREFDRIGENEQ